MLISLKIIFPYNGYNMFHKLLQHIYVLGQGEILYQ